MEKMDIDMVVTIPDTPDRMVGRGSIRREAKRNQHSPDAAGHQREEYRSYLSSRTRRVPEIEEHIEPRMELRGDSDTQTGGVHRLRASRSNALFRKTVDEKGKGKSISTDPRADPPALVQKNPVLNLSKHNGHTNVTAVTSSGSLPSEDRKELRPVHALLGARNSCKLTGSSNNGKEKIECGSPLEGNHNSLKMAWNSNKGKEKVHCDSVSNREIIDLSSDPRQKRGTKRLVRNGCISPHKIAARARQDADQYPTSSLGTMCDWTVQQQMAAAENRSSIGISEIVSENDTDLFHTEQDANPFPRSSRATMCDWSIQHQMAAAENRSSMGISEIVSENDTDLFHTEQDANPFPRSSRATMCNWSIQHQMAAVEKRSSIGISEIVSENDINRGARGKRPEISPIRMVRRDTDGSDGWKSTRNRTLSIGHNSSQHHENSRRNESSSGRICSSVTRLDVHETNGVDRESRQQRRKYEHNIGHGINGRDGNDTRGVSNSESGFDTREPSVVDGESRRQQRKYDHEINGRDGNGTREVSSSESGFEVRETSAGIGEARQRRRRNGFTSAAALYEPEVIVVGPSREPSSPRPTRIQNRHRLGTQVLEINDSSPEVRVCRSRGTRHVENNMNARQIEADEILARELQEQLYREAPLVTDELTDENIARMLEQEENSIRASSSHASGRSTRNSNHNSANTRPRNRLRRRMLMLERRSSNPLLPPRASARVPSGRGQRLGGAPAALRRALNLRFPNDMVLESRLDFLEELENVIGHSSLLHTDRDFTEGDYEMLLRLDENNHRHGGASTHHINNLPQSTVQTENFEETCVICLETPTVGDTIRHLPCLHKFHKDCIDEWLGRNASCPVCKSSVT